MGVLEAFLLLEAASPGSEARGAICLSGRVEARRRWPLSRLTRLSSPSSVLYGVIEALVTASFFLAGFQADFQSAAFAALNALIAGSLLL